MWTSPERSSAVSEIIQKACGYGTHAYDVDGMDVLAVKNIVAERLENIRADSGPQFLEVCTYRFRGHSMGDPERYRTKEKVQKFIEKGPIDNFRKHLIGEKICDEAELSGIEDQVTMEVEEGVRFAHESPEPADEALFENIYVEDMERG